ncbi:MAG: BamA/TamA family outer membrane protein [Succinivibrio sp.]|uniref:BamA/TamA family outer membrane protein n=1 Tax=Succinivibrio faecicola TaxID=2820300 RepID=A0ABS7DEV0_9GAMM|nr:MULTISPECIES: BamA/TamA family outer membrane protein [Succinivibrio]MBQ2381423.1 BamA/TamA family outer membrane protein [Succinivibrio sp.]MBW7569830.1 BamA/TamA family outer membrane protein [Succinivibrio faecicola]MCI6939327.1 BamA/TamA family outer membrane protein [Succinatimonas hippei]MDD6206154.1 BamA/TamA family outer membrane protein [Succinivibrio sp.]
MTKIRYKRILNFTKLCARKNLYMLCLPIFVLCACSSDGKPQKISSLDDPVTFYLTGVDRYDVKTNILLYLNELPVISKQRARLYSREIIEKIQQASHAYGYYHTKVELEYPKKDDEKDLQIKVKVDLGKPLFVRNCDISVIGDGAEYQSFSKIIKSSGIRSYSILDHGKYKKLKEDLKTRALELGLFDAKFSISRIIVYEEQNAADIEILFDTGSRYMFGSLEANDETKELMKPSSPLFKLYEGTNFSSKAVNDYISAMSQTNYYRSIDIRPLAEKKQNNKVPVYIDLQRQTNNLFRVGAGYSTDENFRGILGWDKPLINEKGHSFSSFIRASSVKIDAQAVYKIPRTDPNLDYYYIKLAQTHTDYNDTLSDLSHASIHYVAKKTGSIIRDYYLSAEYEDYKQGIDKDYVVSVMPGILLSKRSSTGGLVPKTGYSISLDTKFSSKIVSDYNFVHSELNIKGVFSLFESRNRILYRFTQGGNFGSDAIKAPASLRFFAGGDQNLRGFSYKSQSNREAGLLSGSRYITSGSVEYNFPIPFENMLGAVFLDSAVYTNDYKEIKPLYGPGIGLRYTTSYGVLKVDVAYGIDNHRKENNLKLHLTFGPEF